MGRITDTVKILIIINVIVYAGSVFIGDVAYRLFSLYYFEHPDFQIWQPITHLFMHDRNGLMHIFFNMFGLYMFGAPLEERWGQKKFLIYYMITGIGAAAIHLIFCQYQIINISNQIPDLVNIAIEGKYNPSIPLSKKLTQLIITPTVGASGAVFGLLLAFGMLFPNALLYLYFAIPIKAKYFVIGYGLIELYAGISNNPADNVAHFAHLGGMIFGYFLIKYWKQDTNYF